MSRILADTSVWVAHFRKGLPTLRSLLKDDRVLGHPLVLIELACGTPPAPRDRTLGDLKLLEQAVVATTEETLALIERERLFDCGCGAIDVALVASARLTPGASLWTLDRNLLDVAIRLGIAFDPDF